MKNLPQGKLSPGTNYTEHLTRGSGYLGTHQKKGWRGNTSHLQESHILGFRYGPTLSASELTGNGPNNSPLPGPHVPVTSVKHSVIPRRKAMLCKSPEAEAGVTVITEAQPLDTVLGLCLVRPATPGKSLERKAFPTEVCTVETRCSWWQAGTSFQPPWGLMAASWAYTSTKRCPAYRSISGRLISKSKQRARREVK